MKIVVTGLAKTGTTGLFYKIRNSLPGRVASHFECHLAPIAAAEAGDHTVVKVLYRADPAQTRSFAGYDRKIAIVRDPRDTLVSSVIYACGHHCSYAADPRKTQAILDLFLAKERGEDVGILDILRAHRRFSGMSAPAASTAAGAGTPLELRMADDLRDHHFFSYDDLVDGNFDALGAYVGIPLTGSADADREHGHVARSRASGGWRIWFNEADVEALRSGFDPILAHYGWDPSWSLDRAGRIDPADGSEYYQRLLTISRERSVACENIRNDPDFERKKNEALGRIMGPDWVSKRSREK